MSNVEVVLPKEGPISVMLASYGNGKLAIRIFDKEGSPLTTLSRNVVEGVNLLDENEFFCKDIDENAEIAAELIKTELFENTGKIFRPPNGFVTYHVWKFIPPKQ